MNPLAAFVAKIRKVMEFLSKFALYLGMGWVIIMMLLTTFDVAGRTFFTRPVPGTIELGEIMLAIFGLLGMAYTHDSGANVKVTMLTQILPKRLQEFLSALTSLMSLVIMGLLSWYGVIAGLDDMRAGTTTDHLGVPTFPLYWLLSLGAGLLSLVLLVQLAEHLLGVCGIKTQKELSA